MIDKNHTFFRILTIIFYLPFFVLIGAFLMIWNIVYRIMTHIDIMIDDVFDRRE